MMCDLNITSLPSFVFETTVMSNKASSLHLSGAFVLSVSMCHHSASLLSVTMITLGACKYNKRKLIMEFVVIEGYNDKLVASNIHRISSKYISYTCILKDNFSEDKMHHGHSIAAICLALYIATLPP